MFVKRSEPAMAETVTRITSGNRKLFVINFTVLFSESIVSQAFNGEKMIFFNPERKNL